MTDKPESLVYGQLNEATFADFVARLRYDCNGPRCRDHGTSHAIFLVERRKLVSGIDKDYTDDWLVYFNSGEDKCFSPQEYWKQCDRHEKTTLNKAMQKWEGCQFMKADEVDQWYVLGELEDHTVTGYCWEWEYVNAHFTHAAAEAFIARKKHDYRDGLRVYVDSQYYNWEFEAIKAAILSGELVYQPKEKSDATQN